MLVTSMAMLLVVVEELTNMVASTMLVKIEELGVVVLVVLVVASRATLVVAVVELVITVASTVVVKDEGLGAAVVAVVEVSLRVIKLLWAAASVEQKRSSVRSSLCAIVAVFAAGGGCGMGYWDLCREQSEWRACCVDGWK